jgi:hypothetical protein
MDFFDIHYTSLLTFAYAGLAAWLTNRVLVATVKINATVKF